MHWREREKISGMFVIVKGVVGDESDITNGKEQCPVQAKSQWIIHDNWFRSQGVLSTNPEGPASLNFPESRAGAKASGS
jgi:hypothetical protein